MCTADRPSRHALEGLLIRSQSVIGLCLEARPDIGSLVHVRTGPGKPSHANACCWADHRCCISGLDCESDAAGEMLVASKMVLLLDEISSGLDSSTIYQICRCIANLAHLRGATVLVSLLQPPPETFNLFDDIFLLAEGVMLCLPDASFAWYVTGSKGVFCCAYVRCHICGRVLSLHCLVTWYSGEAKHIESYWCQCRGRPWKAH